MKTKFLILMLALLFAVTASALELTASAAAYPVLPVKWEFKEKPFALKQIDGIPFCNGGIFQLRNGKTILTMKPESETVTVSAGRIVVAQIYENTKAVHQLKLEQGALCWQVELTNTSKEEIWLEPSLRLLVKPAEQAEYWNGHSAVPAVKAAVRYNKLDETFPLTALVENRRVLALGSSPEISTSYLESGIDKRLRMYYGTRMVLPPGEKNSFEFIVIPGAGQAGWRDAVQGYYRVFPASVKAKEGVDPRLGSGRYTEALQLGHYSNGFHNSTKSLQAGAAHAGLEWGFGMYHRQGDFYGRRELWDFPMTTGEVKAMENLKKRGAGDRSSFDTYIPERAAMFENADRRANVLMTFYLISYVEKGLAEQLGMSQYIFPEMAGIPAYRRGWGHYYGLVGHVFPWATPYEKLLRRDLTELVRDFDIRAIGYDCFADGDNFNVYRGDLEYYLPGWSYDSEGKYIRRGLAYRHNADFIHSLKKDGQTVGLFGNTQPVAMYGFTPDAYMIEGRIAQHMIGEGRNYVLRKRLYVGHKPLHLHMYTSGFNVSDYLNWENMTEEEIRAGYGDFVRDMLSFCWQFGTIPARQVTMSHMAVYRELPTFLEVTSRGWEPVAGVTVDAAVDTARYGTGVGAVTVLSNRERQSVNVKAVFNSNYLGGGLVLPVDFRGGELTARVSAGQAEFDLTLKPQENKLIQYPVILEDSAPLLVTSRKSGDIDRIVYEFKINASAACETTYQAAAEYEFRITSVTLNGTPVSGPTLNLRAGENILTLEMKSNIFRESPDKYRSFAWDKAAVKADHFIGVMLRDFIEGRLKKMAPADGSPSITVNTAANASDRGITVRGDVLSINGSDEFDAQQMAWALFRYLEYSDPRFSPRFEANYGGSENMRKMLAKAGLAQKVVEDLPPLPGKTILWNSGVGKTTAPQIMSAEDLAKLERLTIPLLSPPVGALDENSPVWEKAVTLPDFKLRSTLADPTQKTEVKIFASDNALYLKIICHEANMDQIACEQTERDGSIWHDDDFEIRLAPGAAPDAVSYPYYTLLFNPKGIQADILQVPKTEVIMNEDGLIGQNYGQAARQAGATGLSWNGDWSVKTRIGKKSWNAIVTIPWKTVGGDGKTGGRICLSRYEKPNTEFTSWPPIPFSTVDQPALFAIWEIK